MGPGSRVFTSMLTRRFYPICPCRRRAWCDGRRIQVLAV